MFNWSVGDYLATSQEFMVAMGLVAVVITYIVVDLAVYVYRRITGKDD